MTYFQIDYTGRPNYFYQGEVPDLRDFKILIWKFYAFLDMSWIFAWPLSETEVKLCSKLQNLVP